LIELSRYISTGRGRSVLGLTRFNELSVKTWRMLVSLLVTDMLMLNYIQLNLEDTGVSTGLID
jgi:hypothetical protein